MKVFDVAFLLGSQIQFVGYNYVLATHTKLKAKAAAVALKRGIAKKIIISGGYNLGVKYDNETVLVNPDFSFEAFSRARWFQPSEAKVIADYLVDNLGVNKDLILLEELSTTTEEKAYCLKVILRRTTFKKVKTVAILTLLDHMERALPIFKASGFRMDLEPLFAEELLVLENKNLIGEICDYYRTPKSGYHYPIDRIRQLLNEKKSLMELMN